MITTGSAIIFWARSQRGGVVRIPAFLTPAGHERSARITPPAFYLCRSAAGRGTAVWYVTTPLNHWTHRTTTTARIAAGLTLQQSRRLVTEIARAMGTVDPFRGWYAWRGPEGAEAIQVWLEETAAKWGKDLTATTTWAGV